MAQARSNQLETETRGNLETVIQNAPAAIQNTGTYDGQMPSHDQFVAAYGPQQGPQKFDAFQTATQTARDIFDMKTMPANAIQQMVQDARPTSGGDSAAIDEKRYEAISSAAQATLKARQDDPVSFVQQAFPDVRQAWNAVAIGTGDLSTAMARTESAERGLGIRDIALLPSQVAKTAVTTFKDETVPEDLRIGAVSGLIFKSQDEGQRKAVFDQLVKAGLPEMTQGALLALERGDTGASKRLFQAALIDPTKLPGTISIDGVAVKPSDIDEKVQAMIMADGQVGDVFYGLADGVADNFVHAQRDHQLMLNSIKLRIKNGDTLDQAVTDTAKDLFGNVTPYSRTGAKLVLPADADGNAIFSALQQQLPAVRDALGGQMTTAGSPNGHGQRAVADAVKKNAIDNILSKGFFRNLGDGYAFFDPYTGKAVAGADGKPLVFHPEPASTAIPESIVPSGKPTPAGTGIRDVLMRQN
jgi:hypothetical protein